MRWDQQRQSDNVEDRRGVRMGGMGRGVGGLGIGGLLVLMVLGYLVGGDPLALLRDGGAGVDAAGRSAAPARGARAAPPTDEAGQFIRAVLGSTEDVWTAQFQQQWDRRYQPRRAWCSSPRRAVGVRRRRRRRSDRSTVRPISRSIST